MGFRNIKMNKDIFFQKRKKKLQAANCTLLNRTYKWNNEENKEIKKKILEHVFEQVNLQIRM